MVCVACFSTCRCVFLAPGPDHHDGLPAHLRPLPDQTEETHRQDDGDGAALRGRVPLRQLSPHHQQVRPRLQNSAALLGVLTEWSDTNGDFLLLDFILYFSF